MLDQEIFAAILDSLAVPVVYVDNQHIIRYLNAAAKNRYARFGEILGKSLFDCHNPDSQQIIKDKYLELKSGQDQVLYSENQRRRVFMQAVRDSKGILLGYYERYETKS